MLRFGVMGRLIDAVPEIVQPICDDCIVVNAWRAENVFVDGEDGLAYVADASIRINPSRLLTDPLAVAKRVAALKPAWDADQVSAALGAARASIRKAFQVTEVGEDVFVSLHGKRIRVPGATWHGTAHDLARTRRIEVQSVRTWILDQARATLATSIVSFEWE